MKGCGEREADAVYRHAPLFHRFEQRGLRLGRRAVDLVGEHDVGDDRPGTRRELRRLRIEDGRATTSAGIRSGVKAIRRKSSPSSIASARTASVFPVPGTPSISTWLRASSATVNAKVMRSAPTMTRAIAPARRSESSATPLLTRAPFGIGR